MASRVRGRRGRPDDPTLRKRARHLAVEAAIIAAVCAVFLLKIFSYVDSAALSPSSIVGQVSLTVHNTVGMIGNLPFLNHCPNGLDMQDVPGGYVCAQQSDPSIYKNIYRTYPLVGQGRETVYASTDEGNLSSAIDLLHNQYDVPRYPAIRISGMPTWSENAFSANYWRFEFYSLHPSLDLLYAYRVTGENAYAKKLVSLDQSFVSAEPKSKLAWADPHAVAFRSMALVDTWWKLRQGHQLPEAASDAILGELEKTGEFLADPNNYQQQNNHSVNEAAALYDLAVAFPTLPHAREWLALSEQRFQWQLDGLIDADGQLIENSPYYDFYVLVKYWEIYHYSISHKAPISKEFQDKLAAMLRFATYILQPNSQVPLLGASIKTTINSHGVYLQMAAEDPQLKYVLTHGAQGVRPDSNSVYFAASGLTLMRSGWPRGPQFTGATYLTYNIGRYRTAHSDLDALAITLYGDGGDLLPGAGLYTYRPGAYRNYFHGTESENTVSVDGKSQVQGEGQGTKLVTTDGVTYQAAESSLYSGVTHRRMVMMVDRNHLLVVDRLSSDSVHTYQQMFHLFPGAALTRSGLTVVGVGGSPRRQVTIQQLQPSGISVATVINQKGNNPAGLCSEQYGKLVPCYQIGYSQHARNAEFYTLITIGKPGGSGFSVTMAHQGSKIQIVDGLRRVSFSLGESAAIPEKAAASDPTPPEVKAEPVQASFTSADWAVSGSAFLASKPADIADKSVVRLTTNSTSPSYLRNDGIRLDLSRRNAELKLKVNGFNQLGELRLILSNNHWAKTETMNLLDAYTRTQSGYWASLLLAPSAQWGSNGGWLSSAPGFDWSKVDGVEIEVTSRVRGGEASSVSLGGLSLLPEQKEGKLVIIFDDGYSSILPAASYLHQNGMAANVAAIGKFVDYPSVDHLNVAQLKILQNDWGWNIVNHTQQHLDAFAVYYDHNNLAGYADDILQQAAWLQANGLDSAPNWFIYPHGDTNAKLESVVGRYYMFARTVVDNPDAYPYGDPRAVSNLEIQYPKDAGDSGQSGLTSPSAVLSAVRQAMTWHTTLILTFHRIHSGPGDFPGYPLSLFKTVIGGIRQSGIEVMTLSKLDQSDGVPVKNRIFYRPARPSQITIRDGIAVGAMGVSAPRSLLFRIITFVVIFLVCAGLLLVGLRLWTVSRKDGGAQAIGLSRSSDVANAAPVSGYGRRSPNAVTPLLGANSPYDRQVLSLHPVAYFPLGPSPSGVGADMSGNGHNGTVESGSVPLGVTQLPNGDLASVFNGRGQYVQVPSAKPLSVTDTGALTIEAWIRPDVLQFPMEEGTGYVYVLGKGQSGMQEYALRMYSYRNSETPPRPSRISAYVFNLSGGLGSGSYFQDQVTPGQWMMVTFVIRSTPSTKWPHGYIAIYKNGQLRGSEVGLNQFNVTPGSSSAPFRIAARDLHSYFEGAIAKVAIYDRILSAQDIFSTYQEMVPPNS